MDDEAKAAAERALQLDPAFLYGEPLMGALYREADDSMKRSPFTKKRKQ